VERRASRIRERRSSRYEEPLACRHYGAPVGIFLAHGLRWQHFRGDATTGIPEIYHPGHLAQVTWLLPGEDPEEL
jgi:hypothetical protein